MLIQNILLDWVTYSSIHMIHIRTNRIKGRIPKIHIILCQSFVAFKYHYTYSRCLNLFELL